MRSMLGLPTGIPFLSGWVLVALLVSQSPSDALAVDQSAVDGAVNRGLEWVAQRQSRVGHWAANEGRYPTAMTALAGVALARGAPHEIFMPERNRVEGAGVDCLFHRASVVLARRARIGASGVRVRAEKTRGRPFRGILTLLGQVRTVNKWKAGIQTRGKSPSSDQSFCWKPTEAESSQWPCREAKSNGFRPTRGGSSPWTGSTSRTVSGGVFERAGSRCESIRLFGG